MKNAMVLLLAAECFCCQAQLTFSVSGASGFTLTCRNPTLELTAASGFSGAVNYLWLGSGFIQSNDTVTVSSPGIYSVTATSGTLQTTQMVPVGINTTVPVSSAPSVFTVVSGTNYTFTALSPTVNIAHYVYPPLGPIWVSNITTVVYATGAPGSYTHCIEDMVNGCTSCGTMVVCMSCSPPVPYTLSIGEPQHSGKQVEWSVKDNGLTLKSNATDEIVVLNPDGSQAARVQLEAGEPKWIRLPPGIYIVGDRTRRLKPFKVLVP